MAILLAMVIYVSAQEAYTGAAKPANHQTTQYQGSGTRDWTGCLPCALPEGEPDIPDGGTDTVDGGCNLAIPLFIDIQIGDVYCGRGNIYNNNSYRDTDWYRLFLTQSKTLYWSGIANFPITLIIAQGPCGSLYELTYIANITPGTVGTCNYILGPGEYYFWVGPASWGPGYTGDYMVTHTEQPPQDPWCAGLVPVSNWALIIGGILIAAAILFRYRRMS